VKRDFGLGSFVLADGGDEGMLAEQGFGLAHAIDGATEHHLDGGIGAGLESVFDAGDVLDVGLVGAHPAADAGVEFVEVLDDEGAAGVVAVGTG